MQEPSRLAVLGAGHVGPIIARLAIRAGYPVTIATLGDPEDIALINHIGYHELEDWAQPAGGPVFGAVLTLPEFERAMREDARSLA